METVEFTIEIEEKKYDFKLHAMKVKTCMKTLHTFIGALEAANESIMRIDFDLLEKMVYEPMAKNGYVIVDGDGKTLTLEFFEGKFELFYQFLIEGLQANAPDFFTKARKAMGNA